MEFLGEKLVIKMWDTLIEKGIGNLLKPWQAGREGRVRIDLRRQELITLAQAEKDAADIRSGKKQLTSNGKLLHVNPQQTITHEAFERIEPEFLLADAIVYGNRAATDAVARSEINAAKAILFAEEHLANDTQTPPTQNIDEDWLFMWRDYAGKVSTENLQRMWGNVLAGEVKAPGKYSIRTLEFLKSLSKQEAEMISKLASYVIDGIIARDQSTYLNSKGLSFSALLELQELGVISGVEATGLTRSYKSALKEKFFVTLASHNKALIVETNDATLTLEFKAYKVTAVGLQILDLGSFEPDVDYMRLIGKEFIKQGFRAKLANLHKLSGKKVEYFEIEEITDSLPTTLKPV